MKTDVIKIKWQGPLRIDQVKTRNDEGKRADRYNGKDYGLYQIYGKHILYGKGKNKEALLYIGQAARQTFSKRFTQHWNDWIRYESKGIKIYLGRLDSDKYTFKNNWRAWYRDVDIAEAVLIYKYMPCYNSNLKWEYPDVRFKFKSVRLEHVGKKKHHLRSKDNAPSDYK